MGLWSSVTTSIGLYSGAIKDRVVGSISSNPGRSSFSNRNFNVDQEVIEEIHSTETLPELFEKPMPTRWKLLVETVDLFLRVNGRAHFTDKYYTMDMLHQLIVRRGSYFKIVIRFNRAYNLMTDNIILIFKYIYEDTPKLGQGTYVEVPVQMKPVENMEVWSALIHDMEDNNVNIRVRAPANCICGEWSLEIDTKVHHIYTYNASYFCHRTMYILFNPWCPEDQVYLEEDDLCNEYVLGDTGYIWRGDQNNMMPKVWNYSQFSKDILECTFYLLIKVQKLIVPFCADAVKVTRALTSGITSDDDNCVIKAEFNWKHKAYAKGTSPTDWIGSMSIMQRFYEKKKPVKFGQCWVFAGLLTTACRALGIPCRPVTNYSSGQTKNGSMTIDYYIDRKGEILKTLSRDCIWNFHVWNEVWMKRNDIDNKYSLYGGWQVVDPTPHEMNYKEICCGPTSLYAIKKQEIQKPYDTEFVVSEVNATVLLWRVPGKEHDKKLVFRKPDLIGHNISTKAVGKWQREDITHLYKDEGSELKYNNQLFTQLMDYSSVSSRLELNADNPHVLFELKVNHTALIGQPLNVKLAIRNTSSSFTMFMAHGFLRIYTKDYTGRFWDVVKNVNFLKTIQPDSEKEVTIVLQWSDYLKYLAPQCSFAIIYMVSMDNLHYDHYCAETFTFRKPNIDVQLREFIITVGSPLSGKASFRNPLPIDIKSGYFIFEGSGLDGQYIEEVNENIKVNEEVVVDFQLTPRYPGKGALLVKFSSKYLNDIDGLQSFIVDRKPNKMFNTDATSVGSISNSPSVLSINSKVLKEETKEVNKNVVQRSSISVKLNKSVNSSSSVGSKSLLYSKPTTTPMKQSSADQFSIRSGLTPSALSLMTE